MKYLWSILGSALISVSISVFVLALFSPIVLRSFVVAIFHASPNATPGVDTPVVEFALALLCFFLFTTVYLTNLTSSRWRNVPLYILAGLLGIGILLTGLSVLNCSGEGCFAVLLFGVPTIGIGIVLLGSLIAKLFAWLKTRGKGGLVVGLVLGLSFGLLGASAQSAVWCGFTDREQDFCHDELARTFDDQYYCYDIDDGQFRHSCLGRFEPLESSQEFQN